MSAGYDIEQEDIKKLNNALTTGKGVRDVSTTSGFNVGSLTSQEGGIFAGAYHRISDCETTTTSATSRGVWSASGAGIVVSAAATAKRVGTNCIIATAAAGTAAGDYLLFTCTTGYELDLVDMNYLGFWMECDDAITSFDAAGDLTIEMYQGSTKVYSYAVPAYVAATPYGTNEAAADTQWYIECPLTSSELETDGSYSGITSIRIVKAVTALTNTNILSIDQLEMYEITSGGCPFKQGIIMPFLDSGSGVTKGDYIELANAVTMTVKTGSTDSGLLVFGKACATVAADGIVPVLVYGPTVGIADSGTAATAGDMLVVTDVSAQLVEDGTDLGTCIGRALEDFTTDLDMAMYFLGMVGKNA